MTENKKTKASNNIPLQNNIIDKYYNEIYDNNIIDENIEEVNLFETRLDTMKSNMKISLEEIELDVNILGQLVKAEEIKDKKKGRIESILFILASVFMISFVVITSILNPTLIKYFIGIAVLSPIAVLPITMDLLKGSDSYE